MAEFFIYTLSCRTDTAGDPVVDFFALRLIVQITGMVGSEGQTREIGRSQYCLKIVSVPLQGREPLIEQALISRTGMEHHDVRFEDSNLLWKDSRRDQGVRYSLGWNRTVPIHFGGIKGYKAQFAPRWIQLPIKFMDRCPE